uniref:Matrix metalloproteinase-23 n=1 Tax=Camelus bactrianus TaxID=9837 RepID=A0A9W3ETN5_CAMBA
SLPSRILSFPRNLLSPSETRRGLAAAFRMWSDVSPFSFREVAPEQPSDLRIGFYPVNHTDCLVSPLHHCFDGPTGELAHAFFPPHGGIHFDDSEYWVLGPTRYSWKKGDGRPGLLWGPSHHDGHGGGSWGSWLQWGSSMQGGEGCEEAWRPGFPEPEPPPPPHRRSWSCIPGGQLTASLAWNILIFPWLRRGKILQKKGKVYWYKDQEPLEFSYPGYLALGEAHLSIIANAVNEGTYTCVVRRRQRVLSTYSWRVRVRS